MNIPAKYHLESWRNGIAPRMLLLIVLFSSLVTMLATATQLFLDYQRGVHAIERRFQEIERVSLGSLAVSLWNVDIRQIRLQMEGMLRLPDMQALEVLETMPGVEKPLFMAVGERRPDGSLSRTYPLLYDDHGRVVQVGTLYAEATLSALYDHLWQQALVILISQGIKTFIVSLFTLYIVYRLITRHLIDISHLLRQPPSDSAIPHLHLDRPPRDKADELDLLVQSFNGMADNLHQTLERLTLSNRELERFAYIASHDLQEPLRSVVSFTQLLERHLDGKLDPEGQEYLRYISSGALRMRNLIHDFLEFSQINQSTRPFLPVKMADICQQALGRLAEPVRQSGADITITDLPDVMGDGAQIRVLLEHLLSNALKFRPANHAPSIRIEAGAEGAGWWRFAVHDDGIGIAETQHDIFDVFRRLHPVADYPGTGIGLAICKRIVARHGGTIWVESQSGQGSHFYFTLPALPRSAE